MTADIPSSCILLQLSCPTGFQSLTNETEFILCVLMVKLPSCEDWPR